MLSRIQYLVPVVDHGGIEVSAVFELINVDQVFNPVQSLNPTIIVTLAKRIVTIGADIGDFVPVANVFIVALILGVRSG